MGPLDVAEHLANQQDAERGIQKGPPIGIIHVPCEFANPAACVVPTMIGGQKGFNVAIVGGADVRLDYAMQAAIHMFRPPCAIDTHESAADQAFRLVDAVIAKFRQLTSQAPPSGD